LYARFWAERGNERFASLFMREAHGLYRKWGALAKAEHLEKRYSQWLVSKRISIDSSRTGTSTSQFIGNLDILTVLKASQAIASEIELARLLELLMSSAIENSGAQSGYLLLPEAGEWMIAAQVDLQSSGPLVEQPVPITDGGLLSQGVVNYVARTQQAVLLDDAYEQSDYVDDPHIQSKKVRSLLCTPLVNLGKTSAILYLENNLAPGVFTPERVELLQLLSSQMAISIDNARTHDHLERLLEERSRALDSAEAQIRSLFANSPLGIALSTYGGQFLTVNKALSSMLRISEEDLLQQGVFNFYADAADRDTILAELQESGAVQDFGVQFVRHDGSTFFASVNISQIVLEGNEVLLTMVEDVTDQITAEQQTAVLEERERLARELHDSVTQTLFSASVLTQAAPRLMERNPGLAKQNMEQQSLLIRGALAEMRTLLFELRPGEFTEENLERMFVLLVESTRAQTQANTILNVKISALPPQKVITAFYRIAQESLNNIAKHALAGEVFIELDCDAEEVRLSIKDDGRGFDPQGIPEGHMGVGIMRERAQIIGAEMLILSEINKGTEVRVSWTKSESESINE
jgi:PAS domain S-box-containing protein